MHNNSNNIYYCYYYSNGTNHFLYWTNMTYILHCCDAWFSEFFCFVFCRYCRLHNRYLFLQIAAKIGGDGVPTVGNNGGAESYPFTSQKRALEEAGLK